MIGSLVTPTQPKELRLPKHTIPTLHFKFSIDNFELTQLSPLYHPHHMIHPIMINQLRIPLHIAHK